MKLPTDLRLPHKHAFGPLQTKRTTPFRSKHTRERIRRWAKRVLRQKEGQLA
jgi:hypothetical protein